MSKRTSSKAIVHEPPAGSDHILLTGDRPTGPLHLGHFVGSLSSRIKYQHLFKQYILIADVQALTDNADNPLKVRDNVLEVFIDYLSVGITPELSTIYLQSAIPETAELTLYLLNLVSVSRLSRNPTVKAEIQSRGFEAEVPAGFWTYPVNQAADILQFKASLIPVGLDQVPMIELANDIARRFNRTYKDEIFKETKALVTTSGLLPGTDGNAKMSKSLNNAIFLKDSADVVAKKVKSMFTDPGHLKVEDPGKVEGNTVFTYLDAFDPDQATVAEMKAHYTRGGLADGLVKKRLIEVLEAFLTPIRQRRAELEKDPAELWRQLRKGTHEAREVVTQTLTQVRQAMGIIDLEKR